MRRGTRSLVSVGLAATSVLAGATAVVAEERYQDTVGDALGDATDIVSVVIDEPAGPLLRFSVEMASEPPVGSSEGHLDLLWIALDTTPEVTFPELDGFSLMTMGAALDGDLDVGSQLMVGTEIVPDAVEVTVDGPVVTFSLDSQLLGDPRDLYFRVYSAALHGTLYTEEVDHFPEEDQPPARYSTLRAAE